VEVGKWIAGLRDGCSGLAVVGKALRQPRNSRAAIEPSIEAQDPVDAVLLHDRQVHGVARGPALVSKDDLFCSFNGEDLVNHIEKRVESALDVVTAVYRRVPAQDLLEHFRVGGQALAITDKSF
jgi:hypothetical protein